jgi:transposase-like protein
MKKKLESPYLKRTQKSYSLSFKLQIVSEYENGELGVTALSRKYGIQSTSTITRWIRNFGTFDKEYQMNIMKEKSPQQKLFEQEQKIKLLERQKKTLEKELNIRDQKCIMFDAIVEVVKEEYNIDLSKKGCPKQSKDTLAKEDKA